MKTLVLGAGTLVLLGAVTGCLQQRTYIDPEQSLDFTSETASNMSLHDGRLSGDFGARKGIDGEATRLEGSNDAQYGMTVVNVVREQKDVGAAMVILSISGRTLNDFEPGEHMFSYDENDLSDSQVFVNVCGGNDDSAFDYDAPADGNIVITQTPDGQRQVDIHTETLVLDPSTGESTGTVELSDSSFTYQPVQR